MQRDEQIFELIEAWAFRVLNELTKKIKSKILRII